MKEFACPCCGKNEMDPRFLAILDETRSRSPVPWVITSGYRCEKHNAEVGGKPDSAHTKGLAVDIAIGNSYDRMMILRPLFDSYEWRRIGIGKDFVHIDLDTTKPQNVIWMYS